MTFKLANITKDIKILNQANIDSEEFIQNNIQNNFKNYPYYTEIVKSIKFID